MVSGQTVQVAKDLEYTADGHMKHGGALLLLFVGVGAVAGACAFGERASKWEKSLKQSKENKARNAEYAAVPERAA